MRSTCPPIILKAFHGTLLIGAIGLSAGRLQANWPAWRGADATGSQDTGHELPTSWSPEDATWSIELPGKGGSTPIVWEETIYMTSPIDNQDGVMAIDIENGAVLWKQTIGPLSPARHRTLGSSCNASPTTDGQRLYVAFRSGHIAALDFEGEVLWRHNLAEEFGPEELYWDAGSSPVVSGNTILFTRLHAGESWVAGYDKITGERLWLTPRNFQVPAENDNGYTTPFVYDSPGGKAAFVWAADHLNAYRVESGERLWEVSGFNPKEKGFWPAISSPVLVGSTIVVPVGRDDRRMEASIHGLSLETRDASGNPKTVWTREDVGVFVPSLAAYEGRVYLLRHRGGIVCLDPRTGESVWEAELPRERFSYYSSPTIANGVLYAAREDGTVFAMKVGEEFELLSENPMGEPVIASPVPVGDALLIRGDKNLFCFRAD